MIRIIVWIVMIIGGAILSSFIDNHLFGKIHSDIFFHVVSLIIGVLLMMLVIRISKNTGRTLAKYGRSGNLKRLETNMLVQNGAYSHMRHPMHFGLLLFPLSFALIIGSPSFIMFIAPVEAVLMLVMVWMVEEPEAIRKFGNQYLEYKKGVPWFCFKLKCLKELFKSVAKSKIIANASSPITTLY